MSNYSFLLFFFNLRSQKVILMNMISISVKALSWFDQENQFWEVVLALGNFGADTWYDLKILQQCGKGVKTKS